MKINSTKQIKTRKRRVFSRKLKKKDFNIKRQSIQAVSMLTIGTTILYLLNSIPNRETWFVDIYEAWIDLYEGMSLMGNALLYFCLGLILIISMMCGILLVCGAFIRFTRLVSILMNRGN